MFGSENVQSMTFTIDADPVGSDKYFFARKVPKAITVKNAYMISRQTQNAGTAALLRLENWGTAGTAVEGTITAYLGGTASGSRLTANVPATATVDTAQDNIDEGEWLVLHWAEEGTGWIANDCFSYQVDYVFGQG